MLEKCLISHLYTADPSAHVFEGRLYLFPSHDRETDIADNELGDHFDMIDYHVFSLDDLNGKVTDHGVALHLKDVPWAKKQLWAPDAAFKNNCYYLYFPAKDKQGIFRIGVAISQNPAGPYIAEPKPIEGSFSIDPCSFVDEDGSAYLYFGGLWGGQLQSWNKGDYDPQGKEPIGSAPELAPRIAQLRSDMKEFTGPVEEVLILDENGEILRADDHDRRFFEAAWVHKKNGIYYLSYSTGNTHYLVYAISKNPWGPFTYVGRLMEPVIGWTTHHSIAEYKQKWYLFYHDSSLSSGKSNLRCVKVRELAYDENGEMYLV